MDTGGILIIAGAVLGIASAVTWFGSGSKRKLPADAPVPEATLDSVAKETAERIFNDEFREELRNRGRLHFEKIIGENAMFLQQDLRQTTTQLNDYMRAEITRTLQEEFKKYEQSIVDAKQLALESIEKTVTTLEQQRLYLEQQLATRSEAQKQEVVKRFETEMASIINHYLIQAIGHQIDLSDQLEYILAELEANKQAILEDIQRGT